MKILTSDIDMRRLQTRKKKGFSLLEMTISLVIISFILLIFFNTIVTALDVSYKGIARSFVREEMTSILNLLLRDVRNSDEVSVCEGMTCEIIVGGRELVWGLCDEDNELLSPRSIRSENDIICKVDRNTSELIYKSDDKLKIEVFEFETAVSIGNFSTKTILITIVSSHVNERFNVNNMIRQSSISTRNYEF